MIAVIEGKKIASPEEFHDAIAAALDFPDYYGRNLDALWDCLTGWIDTPATIVWKDSAASKARLGDFGERVVTLLHQAAAEVDDFEELKRIADAAKAGKKGRGDA